MKAYIAYVHVFFFFLLWRCDPVQVMASSFLRFPDHTQRRTTAGRTPLEEWSACRRDLYLTTHNTHNRQTSMPLVGFEPTISTGERPQTYALDRAAAGAGYVHMYISKMWRNQRNLKWLVYRNTERILFLTESTETWGLNVIGTWTLIRNYRSLGVQYGFWLPQVAIR